jgi:lipocalin
LIDDAVNKPGSITPTLDAFLKLETLTKVSTSRLIQSRNDKLKLLCAPLIKRFNEQTYSQEWCAIGLNNQQLEEQLMDMYCKYGHEDVLEIDFERYDAH